MSDFDRKIREALDDEPEDGEFGDEMNIFEAMSAAFRSKNRWLVIWGYVMGFIFVGIGIYALIEFLALRDTPQALPWAVLLIFSLMSILGIKIWYYMELNKNAVLREIVRLERRIKELGEKLEAS